MAENQVYVLREGHIEEDAKQMQEGDRFVISYKKGGEGKKPMWLYEKGRGSTIWGEGFRVVGVDRFTDVFGVRKIGISTYGDKRKRLRVDARAEVAVPTSKTDLGALLEVERILPYHAFLLEHGCPMETGATKKQVAGATG